MADYAAYRATQTGTRANNSQSASVLRQQKQQSRAPLQSAYQPGLMANRLNQSSVGVGAVRQPSGTLVSLRARKAEKRARGDGSVLSVTTGGLSDKIRSSVGKAVHTLATPVRTATDALLRTSWTSAIGTFGLSLIWTNIHVFFRYVLGTAFFNKLGHEWLSGKGQALKSVGTVAEAGGKAVGMAETAAGITESAVLLAADFALLFALLAVITLIAVVVGIISHPIDFVGQAITS